MQKQDVERVITGIVRKDQRYALGAYHFVRNALDFTIKAGRGPAATKEERHVNGRELLEGLRQYTLREFGPMSKFILNEWGVASCHDFGEIVFNLVQHGVLGKSDSDKQEDFTETYTFDDAFIKPYLPAPTPAPVRVRKSKNPTRRRVVNAKPIPGKS